MFKLMLIASAFLVALSTQSFAGQSGNGGSGVICRYPNGQIKSATVLDLFEGAMFLGASPNMGEPSISYQDKINAVIERVDQLDPELARILRQDWGTFLANTQFLSGINLVLIPDAYPVAVTQGCTIEQIAIHRKDTLPGEKSFLINKDLWEAMNNDNKAALVLHEMIYARASAQGASDSRSSRRLVSVITSKFIDEISYVDYVALIRTVGISEIKELNVFGYRLQNVFIDEENVITGKYRDGKTSIVVDGHLVSLMPGKSFLGFYPNGALNLISGSPQPYLLIREVGGQLIRFRLDRDHGLFFYSNGRLKRGQPMDSYTFWNGGHRYSTLVTSDSWIALQQDGKVSSFFPASDEMAAIGLKTNDQPAVVKPATIYYCSEGFLWTGDVVFLTPDGLYDMSKLDLKDLSSSFREGRCK